MQVDLLERTLAAASESGASIVELISNAQDHYPSLDNDENSSWVQVRKSGESVCKSVQRAVESWEQDPQVLASGAFACCHATHHSFGELQLRVLGHHLHVQEMVEALPQGDPSYDALATLQGQLAVTCEFVAVLCASQEATGKLVHCNHLAKLLFPRGSK
jgi:hypothetical protein